MLLKEELKEWDQCLSMLGEAKVDDDGNVYDMKDSNVMYLDKDCEDREINVSSLLYIYIYMDATKFVSSYLLFLDFTRQACKFIS